MFSRILKPWFVFRPSQILRRIAVEYFPPRHGLQNLKTAWGCDLFAYPGKTIGASVLRTGVHDLVVSEAIFRLAGAGSVVFDVGANVGYMTLLAANAAAPGGRVVAFEPHPELFRVLAENTRRAECSRVLAGIEIKQIALGAEACEAYLSIPEDFAANDGLASVCETQEAQGRTIAIRIETVDNVLGGDAVDVMKLDVEGYEANVLRGAKATLAEHRVKHIIFEEHHIETSEVVGLLREANYTLFALGWRVFGPIIGPVEAGSLATAYESATFLATLDPNVVTSAFSGRGWRALKRRR